MHNFLFNFIIFYLQIYYVLSDDQCAKNDNNCSNSESEIKENKYARASNTKYAQLLEKIENAVNKYEPCKVSNCSCYSGVISKDLKLFKSGITEEIIKSVKTKGTKYQIFNGRLYRDKDCLFPSRCQGIEYFLLKLAPKMPNMELIINTRDWPQIRNFGKIGPVFSFSKSYDYADVMYPTWSFWEGGPAISLYPRGLGRWDTHRISVSQAGDKKSWENKKSKAFFRGSRTSSERDPLVLLSRENFDLVDAQYTKNQAWKSDADTLHAAPASEVSLEAHCNYKYLFNFRGVAASFRFKHLFLCKSLVFHVGDEWIEFFYPLLKPWVHYIPVDTRASKDEIKFLIEFARENDEIVREIAQRGYDVIWDHLKMDDVLCYWRILLKRYYKLLMYEPVFDKSLIQIKNK